MEAEIEVVAMADGIVVMEIIFLLGCSIPQTRPQVRLKRLALWNTCGGCDRPIAHTKMLPKSKFFKWLRRMPTIAIASPL
jgi:hypothetical protein